MNLDPVSRPQTVEQWLDILENPKRKNKTSLMALLALCFSALGAFLILEPNMPDSSLKFGQTIETQCTENDLYPTTGKCQKNYYFQGKKGEVITLDMTSSEIDSLLVLMDSEGNEIAKNDDISVDNFNAQIVLELPKDDKYMVSTQSSQEAETGAYILKATKN